MSKIHKSLQSLAVNIDQLSFMEGNPRKGDVEAVSKSYEQFGQRKNQKNQRNHLDISRSRMFRNIYKETLREA